jgi:hypothetical protein
VTLEISRGQQRPTFKLHDRIRNFWEQDLSGELFSVDSRSLVAGMLHFQCGEIGYAADKGYTHCYAPFRENNHWFVRLGVDNLIKGELRVDFAPWACSLTVERD